MDSGSEVNPANSNVNLDELDPIIKEIIESINPESPELIQAALILDYCGKKGDDLKTNLEACNTEILELQRRGHGSVCLINDAIHGPIELSPLVYKIINTPEFHRLKNIKQLGAAHYVYPGANHTRFDHSIGVFFLAGEFAQHLQRQAKDDFPQLQSGTFKLFTDGEVICAQIAGLCHDLGHGPFSHLFGHYVMKSLEHEDLSVSILKKLISDNINVLAEFVSSKEGLGINDLKLIELMIQPPKMGKTLPEPWAKREFLREIVANKTTGVDVDKWDYYARDCHYLGVTMDFQQKRCMLLGRIVEDSGEYHIAFRDKELDNIYGMFRTRAILHQKAYQHKTIKAVERMIADAIIEVKELPLLQILGSEYPVSIMTAIKEAEEDCVGPYLALTDGIIEVIKCCPIRLAVDPSSGKDNSNMLMNAKDLLRRIETRDLYHLSWKVRVPKIYRGSLTADSHKEDESKSKAGESKSEEDESKGGKADESKSEEGESKREEDESKGGKAGESKSEENESKSKEDKSKGEDRGDKLWQAVVAMSKQPEGESINEFLAPEKQKTIEKKHLWVPTERIKLPSEERDNPITDIRFYKKPIGDGRQRLLTKEEVKDMTSLLVVPQAFIECEVRVYDKRRLKDRAPDDEGALRDALIKWRKHAEIKHNGHGASS